MKKLFKKLGVMLTALALACAFGALAVGCGGSDTFEIAVQYEDGAAVNPADGTGGMNGGQMFIQLCNKESGKCYKNVALNADGKVSISIAEVVEAIGEGTYKVYVVGAPDGYKDVDDEKVYGEITADNYEITVKLEK